ncbi:n-acetylmuramoyl-L-alanine amidase [Fusobacterium sp. CAG:439]|nr:n-acetylmuramoyl-L-alanine amidase [Fusobacterium sp. CAG:439]
MKKILILFTLFIITLFTFVQKACAEELYKFTSANFDTSNSIIVLSGQDTPSGAALQNIKLVKMENPSRAYFDIDSSIITFPKQDWKFQSGGIKEVKINQFSTNPNVVRVVMYFDNDFNPDNIKFLRIKNNIIIKLKNGTMCDNEYFHNTYRDEHSSSSDFYEYLTIMMPVAPANDTIVDQIQDAFNTQAEQIMARKELKLNTKYYLNNIAPRPNGVLINGFGAVTIEKPMILTNPSRIIYDLPNTLVDMKIRNKEYRISETETVKIGQFSVNKARIVITTDDVSDYIPIYSSDNQSLIIANYKKTNNSTLYNSSSNATAYNKEKTDSLTESMILKFDAPVVHGLDRYQDKIVLYLYNVSKYHDENFKAAYKNTLFSEAQISLMPKIGLKLTIPVEQDALVSTYLGADGRSIKIKVKEAKKKAPEQIVTPPSIILNPSNNTNKHSGDKKKVVIDAGHGGTDVGATSGGIYEKDITLDVAKRVEKLLKQKGYQVVMTRPDDTYVSLQDRVAISEQNDPDIFVSIHVNSSVRPEITGVETHYYHQESMALAQTVHSSFASAVQSPNRGLFKSKFYVINHTTVPAILVEIGFISNSGERAQLIGEKRKQATAKSIADGVQNYFKQFK